LLIPERSAYAGALSRRAAPEHYSVPASDIAFAAGILFLTGGALLIKA